MLRAAQNIIWSRGLSKTAIARQLGVSRAAIYFLDAKVQPDRVLTETATRPGVPRDETQALSRADPKSS